MTKRKSDVATIDLRAEISFKDNDATLGGSRRVDSLRPERLEGALRCRSNEVT
jgi:hypothetical protein